MICRAIHLKGPPERSVESHMTRLGMLLLSALLVSFPLRAAEPSFVYVQVVRGSDHERPQGTNYRAVGPKLIGKLSPVFRWKNYWETERQKVEVRTASVTKVPLANQRSLELERLKTGELEVRLFRRSGLVTKARQASNERMAILGGEEAGKDSFFVIVRPDAPIAAE